MSEQAEGLAKYPVELNNTDFITQIYQATLGRAPDAAGLAYWQEQLTNNNVGRDVFLAAVINGAKANSSAQGVLDAATLSNKATAGVAFADKGLNDLTLAGQVVASVNSNPDTLAAVQAVIKLVPATAAGVTPALIALLSKTFDSIINLNAKAPGEVGDLATYLTAVANQASGTTDLSTLLTNVTATVTKAAMDSAALDNPASLAGDAVTAATPSTGGGGGGAPVTPTFKVIDSKEGRDEITLTGIAEKFVVSAGNDAVAEKAALASVEANLVAANLIVSDEALATAVTDADNAIEAFGPDYPIDELDPLWDTYQAALVVKSDATAAADARDALHLDVANATAALDARDALHLDVANATAALEARDALHLDVVDATAALEARDALHSDVVDAAAALEAAEAYYSPANLADHDIITGFSLSADKLGLPVTDLLTGSFGADKTGNDGLIVTSITNGVVTFGGDAASDASVEAMFSALLTAMGSNKSTAAFVAGADTYVVQGNGVAGVQNTDILVQLVGVSNVTDLGAIIV